jgi:hypothetical protein
VKDEIMKCNCYLGGTVQFRGTGGSHLEGGRRRELGSPGIGGIVAE